MGFWKRPISELHAAAVPPSRATMDSLTRDREPGADQELRQESRIEHPRIAPITRTPNTGAIKGSYR
ncbi:hypothetical protein GCM10028812_51250 [Ancylobacter sonchi]